MGWDLEMRIRTVSHAKGLKNAVVLCRRTKRRLHRLGCCTLVLVFTALVVLGVIGSGYLSIKGETGQESRLNHTFTSSPPASVKNNESEAVPSPTGEKLYNISFYVDSTIDRAAAQQKLFSLKSTFWPVQFFGTKEDAFHVQFVYNKVFVGVADLLPTLPPQTWQYDFKNLSEIILDPEKALQKYIILNEHYTELSRTFVEKFVSAMMNSTLAKRRLIIYLPTSAVASFTELCLKQQAAILLPPGTDVSRRRKFVLITGANDLTASMSFADVRWKGKVHVIDDLLQHPLLAHWFAQNGDLRHAKFTCLPIGIDYHTRVRLARPPQSVTATEQELNILKYYIERLNVSSLLPPDVNVSGTRLVPYWQEAITENAHSSGQELAWSSVKQLSLLRQTSALGGAVQAGVIVTPILPPSDPRATSDVDLLSRVALVAGHGAGAAGDGEGPHGGGGAAGGVSRLYLTVPTLFAQAQQSWSFGDPRRTLRVIVAFNAEHAPEFRVPVSQYLHAHMHDIAVDAAGPRERLWSMMQQNAFIASPIGVGYDCHRTWEALVMGCIPIVYHPDVFTSRQYINHFTPYRDNISELQPDAPLDVFRDLPVIVVRDFEKEVTLENLVRWREEVYKNFTEGRYKLEKLFNQYWIDRFYSA